MTISRRLFRFCCSKSAKNQDRLGEEAARCINYLATGTEPKLKHIVETELILKHAKLLVEMEHSGCQSMFRDDKVRVSVCTAVQYPTVARCSRCLTACAVYSAETIRCWVR